ncbi:MAG TPA: hypothetical protein VNI83_08105 [Vicinamibacterales bacterium]|nr:hypothetical protein [Vicinamibacterales bacterium]
MAARSIEDEAQRRDAFIELVREALGTQDVRPSGTAYPNEVHPADNQPAPVVNFDIRLNQKSSARRRDGGPVRSLERNFGYYFSVGGKGYVVLGPAALDPRSPVFTRMAAEHELFHAQHHVGDPRPLAERELEAWTHVFITFFHDVYSFRQRWAPLVGYYEEAGPAARKAALEALAAYYRTPPSTDGGTANAIRTAFEEWLARRKKDPATADAGLVADLEQAIAVSGQR